MYHTLVVLQHTCRCFGRCVQPGVDSLVSPTAPHIQASFSSPPHRTASRGNSPHSSCCKAPLGSATTHRWHCWLHSTTRSALQHMAGPHIAQHQLRIALHPH